MTKFDPSILKHEDYATVVRILGFGRIYKPDFVIAPNGKPYLYRWHLMPRRGVGCEAYLHIQVASDPERPPHDHPYDNQSVILAGGYDELCRRGEGKYAYLSLAHRHPGDTIQRRAEDAHRLILPLDVPYSISLFTTGPARRAWGFWDGGTWTPFEQVTDVKDGVSTWKDDMAIKLSDCERAAAASDEKPRKTCNGTPYDPTPLHHFEVGKIYVCVEKSEHGYVGILGHMYVCKAARERGFKNRTKLVHLDGQTPVKDNCKASSVMVSRFREFAPSEPSYTGPKIVNPSNPHEFEAALRESTAHIAGRQTYPALQPTFGATAQDRKERPMARGLLDYFPDALAEVANVSYVGNKQHNPGEEVHWAWDKSTDEADCLLRHLTERGTRDTDGLRHSAKVAWRALALLQRELVAAGAPMPPAARKAAI